MFLRLRKSVKGNDNFVTYASIEVQVYDTLATNLPSILALLRTRGRWTPKVVDAKTTTGRSRIIPHPKGYLDNALRALTELNWRPIEPRDPHQAQNRSLKSNLGALGK